MSSNINDLEKSATFCKPGKAQIRAVRDELRAWFADKPDHVRRAGNLVLSGLDSALIRPRDV